MSPPETKVEILSPRQGRAVVIGGWSVPFLEATELDGGRIWLKLDHRFGLEVDAEDFEPFVAFLAQAVAVGLGYWSHPNGDEVDISERFASVPHPAIRPRRIVELTTTQKPQDEEER